MKVSQRKELAAALLADYKVSVTRACSVILLQRSVWYYKKVGRNNTLVVSRMRDIAMTRVRYGARRIFVLLRREGFKDNHKRIHRLYKLEGLNLRIRRPRRNRAAAHRQEQQTATSMNACWSMISWPTASMMGANSGP